MAVPATPAVALSAPAGSFDAIRSEVAVGLVKKEGGLGGGGGGGINEGGEVAAGSSAMARPEPSDGSRLIKEYIKRNPPVPSTPIVTNDTSTALVDMPSRRYAIRESVGRQASSGSSVGARDGTQTSLMLEYSLGFRCIW